MPPFFYEARWNILDKLHRPIFGLAIGRVVMFIVLLIVMVVGAIATKGDEEGSGGLATLILGAAFVFVPKNNVVNLFIGLPFERAL